MEPLASDAGTAQELKQAFAIFNQVSANLTQAYEQLQGRVASLSAELAVANGELRRQFEEKEALSARLTLLLNALPAGVVAVDATGCIRELNPAAVQMLGEALPGRNWDREVAGHLRPTETESEYWLDPPAGEVSRRRVQVAESRLASGQLRILLLHDVTGTHEMKASLERSHRLAAMGEMAASLAHQLRTPLSAALLYSSNLGRADLSDEARARFAERASDQLRRLERLIHDVLLFARGEEIGREAIAVGDLVDEVVLSVDPVFRERGLTLSILGNAREAVVVGSRKPLAGALVSLLENALQVSPPGGEVGLCANFAERQVRISVRDQGPGIAPEVAERVFEPFFTTRAQGTGLGLAIALGVAKAHGGTIEVSSTPGQGAEFALLLPAAWRALGDALGN